MICLDLSLPEPVANLALDDALLEAAEKHGGGEVLRFWESSVPFVVMGAGSPSQSDVDLPACRGAEIPVLRRSSGGGTVVQGPGCLNYALVLDRQTRPELHSIDSTNRAVLQSVGRALGRLGIPAEQAGVSDLGVDGRKFSGNAQRRKKRHLLFHGTVLYGFDLSLIARCLREPERQPEWRALRRHDDFVRNLDLHPEDFKRELRKEWAAECGADDWPRELVAALIEEKFTREDWIFGL